MGNGNALNQGTVLISDDPGGNGATEDFDESQLGVVEGLDNGESTGDSTLTFELKVNGQTKQYEQSEIQGVIDSQNADYTQKSQVLARQTEQLKPLMSFYQELQNPDIQASFLNWYKGIESDDNEQSPAGISPELNSRLSSLEEMANLTRFDSEITTLTDKYGKRVDAGEIANSALAKGITDPKLLEGVFLELHAGDLIEDAKVAAGKDLADNTNNKLNASVARPKPGMKAPPAVDVTKMSPVDKRNTAINALKRLMGG